MAKYAWFPLGGTTGSYTWDSAGNWTDGAYWAAGGSAAFPPAHGTVPGASDTAYILAANVPSSAIPSQYPRPPYNVGLTIDTAQTVGSLGMAMYQPFDFLGYVATQPVINIDGTHGGSLVISGSIVDNFTYTFPSPVGLQSATGGGKITLGSSASLEIGTTVDAGITVNFNDGSNDKVILDGVSTALPTAALGQFTGFQAGDIINLSNIAFSGASLGTYTSGHLTILSGGVKAADLLIPGLASLSSFSLAPGATSGLDIVTCFAEGTRIQTPAGEIAIEALRAGDLVTIRDPATATEHSRPIRWIGRRRINLRRHRQPELASPVRIRRGACADGLPRRDLLVSPDHAIFLDGVLIPARLLVNGATIAQETDLPAVQYFHIELDNHAILLAEGMPAESYLDTGNRASFENAGTPLVLHPDFAANTATLTWSRDACAELAVGPSAVEPIWRRLAERATALGFPAPEAAPLPAEAAPWLEVNGQILRATTIRPGHHVFALPAHLRHHPLALRSEAARPSDRTPWLNDRRRLGIAVERILLHHEAEVTEIPLDHPALAAGWWQAERDAARLWRWTDGNSALPALAGAHMIEIRTAGGSPKRPNMAQAA